MSAYKLCVGVVPVGEVPEIALKAIAANIEGKLNLNAEVLTYLKYNLDAAYNPIRNQYDAGLILKAFHRQSFPNHGKVIGVVNVDLFNPLFTHLFGEARLGDKFGLASIYRLNKNEDGSIPSRSRFLSRLVAVALHELGHLFNLLHCSDSKCLMHFSGDIDDLDVLSLQLCRYCSSYLRSALHKL